MKLIIKRIGPDPRYEQLVRVGDSPRPMGKRIDSRPLGLCTEAGEPLPCQASLVIENEPHRPPKVIVTFTLDGDSISLE